MDTEDGVHLLKTNELRIVPLLPSLPTVTERSTGSLHRLYKQSSDHLGLNLNNFTPRDANLT